MITLTDYGWRHAGRKHHALRHLNLSIHPGEKVLLLGASGSGKSTLLSAIAGVLGSDGESEGKLDTGAPPVGMVLQDPDSQVIAARVGDDVAFGCENLAVPRDEIWSRVDHALATVGLDLPLNHPTTKLSGGQKQRLALAGVIAMRPGVIVLDEPTANLDPAGVAEVREAVAQAAADTGATLVIVEHRVEVWRDVAERAIVLDSGGKILADGPINEVLDRHRDELLDAGVWVPDAELPMRKDDLSAVHTTDATPLLTTTDLVAGWPGSTGATEPLNLRLLPGCTCLTGPNGAGKTTLALTLAGLLKPISGRVSGDPHTWRSGDLARRIGYVFQDPEHQFVAPTVAGEVGGDLALLEELGLAQLAQASPFTLSGGEKRHLSLATMLRNQPEVLIIDEPTFGQDRNSFAATVRLLQGVLARGTAILAITHDQDFIDALADHRWELP